MIKKALLASLALCIVFFFSYLGYRYHKRKVYIEALIRSAQKAREERRQEEEELKRRVPEHPDHPPINIQDFRVFLKEFRKALENKDWPKVHAMWENQEEAKVTPNVWGRHPDIEQYPDIYDMVLQSLDLKNCDFFKIDAENEKLKTIDYTGNECTYETPDTCSVTHFWFKNGTWKYSGSTECH